MLDPVPLSPVKSLLSLHLLKYLHVGGLFLHHSSVLHKASHIVGTQDIHSKMLWSSPSQTVGSARESQELTVLPELWGFLCCSPFNCRRMRGVSWLTALMALSPHPTSQLIWVMSVVSVASWLQRQDRKADTLCIVDGALSPASSWLYLPTFL